MATTNCGTWQKVAWAFILPHDIIVNIIATDAFLDGCSFVGLMPPGLATSAGDALATPVGDCLHFAATETSPLWCGYFEGALVAGKRAGAEVLAGLGGRCRSKL